MIWTYGKQRFTSIKVMFDSKVKSSDEFNPINITFEDVYSVKQKFSVKVHPHASHERSPSGAAVLEQLIRVKCTPLHNSLSLVTNVQFGLSLLDEPF